jgi:HK97 family phage major capsid protein
MWGPCNSNSVEFWRETTFTNNADVVSEDPANGKPVSVIDGSLQSAPVATIAHRIKASNQILSDVPMLKSYIDGKMAYGYMLAEEEQLLKGSGVGLNINGLYTQATAYSQPAGVDVDTETRIDRLRLAMLQAELANYYADGIVLSLEDWTNIQIQKNADKVYLLGSAQGILTPTLWGLPVVATKSMDAGDFLVGAFAQGAQAWMRENMTVALSTEDGDNFSNNMVTIRAEGRVALTVYQTGAFVKGDFDGLPT